MRGGDEVRLVHERRSAEVPREEGAATGPIVDERRRPRERVRRVHRQAPW